MRVNDWLNQAIKKLNQVGIESSRLDCLIILETTLNRDRTNIIAHPDLVLDVPTLDKLNRLIDQRSRRIPIAYLIGNREFYGLNIKVDESVLIPRPETEVLVEAAINSLPKSSTVLEIGTGSGAISIALKVNRPDLIIDAIDISQDALIIAQQNARLSKVDINFIHSDMFNNLEGKKYNSILANLPYVPKDSPRQPEINYEPDIALYSGSDGLDLYRELLANYQNFVTPDHKLILEFMPSQRETIEKLAAANNLSFEQKSNYVYFLQSMK